MSIYKRLGVEPLINVVGAWTIYGSALMADKVLEAHEKGRVEKEVDWVELIDLGEVM